MDNFVPIAICCILPIAIVAIYFYSVINSDNKRSKVLIKAIEINPDINLDKFVEAFGRPRKTQRELNNRRLQRGIFFSLSGLIFGIMGIIYACIESKYKAPDYDEAISFGIIGGILLALGVAYSTVYLINRKMPDETPKVCE